MARVTPFHAMRYRGEGLRRLTEPFDTLEPRERRLAAGKDLAHPSHLQAAPNPQGLLRSWVEAGELTREEKPALYLAELEPKAFERVYRPTTRVLLGQVTPDAKLLPLEEGEAPGRFPPVQPVNALAADDHRVLLQLFDEVTENLSPVYEVELPSEVLRLYRLESSPIAKRIQATLDESPIRPLAPLSRELPSLLAIWPLSDPGLRLRPIHRGLKQVATFHPERFLTLVREYARIYDVDARLDTQQGLSVAREKLAMLSTGYHAVLLVLPGGVGKILRFRQALDFSHLRAAPKSPTLRSLDLALLNSLVLQTVLAIEKPDAAGHAQVHTVTRLEELVADVETGTFQAGFALNPPPVWELRAVMAASQQLPPHTLELWPRLPEGTVYFLPEKP